MKNGDLSIVFFQSREQVVVQWGQIRRIEWMIKTLEAQVGQFLLGCKCPVSRGIVVQEQEPTGYYSEDFLQIVHQLHQQKLVILRVDSSVHWKVINKEEAVLILKIEARTLPADFCTRNFLGRAGAVWGDSFCCDSIDCCFVSGT